MQKQYTKMVIAGLFLLMIVQAANSALLNTELVVNGNAETGDTSGWVSTGIDAASPDSFSAGFGSFVFTGGTGAGIQTLFQSIDLTSNATNIDAGQIKSIFSIELQHRATSSTSLDQARVDISMLDDSNNILDSFFFEDIINIGVFDWNNFSDSRTLLSGTRTIEVLLTATRSGGLSTDSYFDEVSLQINNVTSVPAPTAVWLLFSGLIGLIRMKKKSAKLSEKYT